MSIQFRCPTCQCVLSASDDKAGTILKCPRCGGGMTIPQASPPIASPVKQTSHSASDQIDFGAVISFDPSDNLTRKRRKGTRSSTILWTFGVLCSLIVISYILYVNLKTRSIPEIGHNAPASNINQPGGIRLIPEIQAFFRLSPEQEAVKRYVLRSSLNPDAIQFEKWFSAKDASPEDSNAFELKARDDAKAKANYDDIDRQLHDNMEELRRLNTYSRDAAENRRRAQLFAEAQKRHNQYLDKLRSTHWYAIDKVMTADRVVRVITRTNVPIVGSIRTDDFYYLKDGKVVNNTSGTPASQDKLIELYYPGED